MQDIEECKDAANRLQGSAADQAVDDFGSLIHKAIYEDAAHGMSAIAMLAPLYERTIQRCLWLIGTKYHLVNRPNPSHLRWSGDANRIWDCRYVWEGMGWRKDIHAGTGQLLDALDLLKAIPPDFMKAYSVLVAYRNKMFHHGLEWPLEERKAFISRGKNEDWPQTWFSLSEKGHEAWMISMTDSFVDLCIDQLIQIADLFGNYVHEKESALSI